MFLNPVKHSGCYRMSVLSCPWTQQLLWGVMVDAGFLCYNAAAPRAMIKETFCICIYTNCFEALEKNCVLCIHCIHMYRVIFIIKTIISQNDIAMLGCVNEVCVCVCVWKEGTEFLSIIEVTFRLQSLYVTVCTTTLLLHFIQCRILVLCRNDMQFSYLYWY